MDLGGRTFFLMRGGHGCGVCAEIGGRVLILELFRDGQKPGQWT